MRGGVCRSVATEGVNVGSGHHSRSPIREDNGGEERTAVVNVEGRGTECSPGKVGVGFAGHGVKIANDIRRTRRSRRNGCDEKRDLRGQVMGGERDGSRDHGGGRRHDYVLVTRISFGLVQVVHAAVESGIIVAAR